MADEGLIAAAGTVAAGAALVLTDAVFEKIECNAKEDIEKQKKEGHAKAIAIADYACKYFKAAQQNAKANTIIALIQQAASFYLADKQHDVAKQAQKRFDDIWNNQREKADKLFDHWDANGRPAEAGMLAAAMARRYHVDYETAKNRSVATARQEFSRAREKVQRESNVHCVGATRTALRQLHAAEARAAVLATNQAIRLEEERKHQRESQYREESYKWAALIQGALTGSSNAIRTAQQAAAAAGSIDPYAGWAQAVGGLSNIGVALSNGNMASHLGGVAASIPAFITQ